MILFVDKNVGVLFLSSDITPPSGIITRILVGGSWRDSEEAYICISGTWRSIVDMSVISGGSWKTGSGT